MTWLRRHSRSNKPKVAIHSAMFPARLTVRICVAVAMGLVTGCNSPTTTVDSRPTFDEATQQLSDLQWPITDAIRGRKVSSVHDELHEAMYLADHLPEFPVAAGATEPQREAVTRSATRLFQKLTAAHNGVDGNGGIDSDTIANEINLSVTEVVEVALELRQPDQPDD